MQNVIDNEVQAPEVYRFEGLEAILDAHKRIEKANVRLAKAGIEDRFEAVNIVSGEFELVEGRFPFQTKRMVDFEEFELNHPVIGYEGWKFVASVSFEEGGTIVNTVPGQSLIDWERPEAHLCEHCNLIRNRNRSYVLRNEEGQYLQVGSSCLALFLGINPALWAVGFELPEQDREGSDFSRYEEFFDIRRWIALVLAVSENGAGFISRSKARESESQASVDSALEVFYPNRILMGRDREYAAWINESREESIRIFAEEQDLIEAVIESGKSVGSDSDYGMNLQVVLNSEEVSRRSLGILSSVVGVHHRNVEREAERKANPAVQGFLGEVKERLRNVQVTVTGIKYLEGAYGTTSLVSMRAASGHTLKWFASGVKEFEIGQELVADFTVKAHEEYNGVDQTMVTRLTVKN